MNVPKFLSHPSLNIKAEPVLFSRKQIAQLFGCNVRTIQRYEKIGMPRIVVKGRPKYVYQEVLQWVMNFRSTKGGENKHE